MLTLRGKVDLLKTQNMAALGYEVRPYHNWQTMEQGAQLKTLQKYEQRGAPRLVRSFNSSVAHS